MICEKCGCHDRVIRTVRNAKSTTRIRRCIACGNAVVTEERQIEAEPDKAKPAPKPRPRPKRKKSKSALENALSSAN